MNRLPLAFAAVFLAAFPVWADDPAPETPQAESTEDLSLADQLKADPNNVDTINKYMIANLGELRALVSSDPEKASTLLKEMDELINSLEADNARAKSLLGQAKRVIGAYGTQVEAALTSIEDLTSALEENADDVKKISMYILKVQQTVTGLVDAEPKKAGEQLKAAKEFLASIKEKATTDEAKRAVDGSSRAFARVESTLRQAELIGMDAAPLDNVEGWTNGSPLTDADLKGKVVLLDFWAIWCGPCVATFPHLIEWHEKYSDKGLEIIGLTRYYGYKWDEEAGKTVQARGEEVKPEQEQEAMQKFVEEKGLHHRIAFQTDRALSEYYAVTGIPHVVVIDREGKVRLIRVGSGEKNAQDVEAMIQELIASGGA
jgi:thiol-disulfide isomerase/thioredoxin